MSRRIPRPLVDRVVEAAEAALAAQHYASPLDVFLRIGWLNGSTVAGWRQGRTDCLEAAIQASPARIDEALELLRAWAAAKGLCASETSYAARTPQRQILRFSRSGDPALEQTYRTHWLSTALPEKKRQRLAEKTNRAPELVVIQPLNDKWTCHRCGGIGDLLVMENPGPACLSCVGLGDLTFLASGNALLTRRAKSKSARHAVVVRFSRSRRRYERQGWLFEPAALAEARQEIGEA
jgi:hypothetical protein